MMNARKVVNLSGCLWSHNFLSPKKENRAISEFEDVFRKERGKLNGSGDFSETEKSGDKRTKGSVESGENRHERR